jgi:hypothetical protein
MLNAAVAAAGAGAAPAGGAGRESRCDHGRRARPSRGERGRGCAGDRHPAHDGGAGHVALLAAGAVERVVLPDGGAGYRAVRVDAVAEASGGPPAATPE